jgi:hypothetical protein
VEHIIAACVIDMSNIVTILRNARSIVSVLPASVPSSSSAA